jgi:hypothetical protein
VNPATPLAHATAEAVLQQLATDERRALANLFRAAQRLLPAATAWHTATYGEGPPPAAIVELREALIDPGLESLVRRAVTGR